MSGKVVSTRVSQSLRPQGGSEGVTHLRHHAERFLVGVAGASEEDSEYPWCGLEKSPTHVPRQPEPWDSKTFNPPDGQAGWGGRALPQSLAPVVPSAPDTNRARLPRPSTRSQDGVWARSWGSRGPGSPTSHRGKQPRCNSPRSEQTNPKLRREEPLCPQPRKFTFV